MRHHLSAIRVLATREIGAVLVLAVVTALLLAFAGIAAGLGDDGARGFDRAIMLGLRDAGDTARPVGPAWLPSTMLDFTALGGGPVLTLVTLVAAAYLLVARKGMTAVFVVAAVAGGSLLNVFLKSGFDRARPDLVAHLVQVQSTSFPSGHAMNSAIVYLTLGSLLARGAGGRRAKAFVLGTGIVLTLIIGASRVYLGVHWPTDVLAGWAVGASWAALCWLAELWLQRRHAIEPSGG